MPSFKIYVAANNQEEGRRVAAILKAAGHTIVSTWLDEYYKRTEEHTEPERVEIADRDIAEVMGCDWLVLLASPYRTPGGKFVETGVAIGAGKRIALIGQRENMLLWSSGIWCVRAAEDLLERWAKQT